MKFQAHKITVNIFLYVCLLLKFDILSRTCRFCTSTVLKFVWIQLQLSVKI